MGITIKKASVTTVITRSARIYDGAAKALTVLHLREFLRLVDEVGGIDDNVRVSLRDDLQHEGSWHTVEISAAVKEFPELDDEPEPRQPYPNE